VDDLDFIDLISVAEYSEEWEKKKKPIQKKIRRYYLLHEVGVKGLFLSAAGAVLLLQYTPTATCSPSRSGWQTSSPPCFYLL